VLTALPRPLVELSGPAGMRKGEGTEGEEGGERRKGEDPQCLKYVDANDPNHITP